MDLKIFIPPVTNTSIILSKAEESEPVSFITCLNFCILGIFGVTKTFDLAFDQFLLPLMALISPLCANNLKG